MALGLAVKAFKAAAYLWNKPMTLGTAATMAAIPLTTAVVDHETDGALSQAAYQVAIDTLKEKVKEGVSPEAIERTMDGISYVAAITNRLDKFAQNVAVLEIMGQNDGAEAIKKGKAAAVAYQVLNSHVLLTKQALRQTYADEMFNGDRNAADKYMANSLIDDIVKGAQVNALNGNQVTRDDVKNTLAEIIKNPDQHPVASKFFSARGRLMNGLQLIWPDLAPEVAPAQRPAVTAGERSKERSSLRDAFSAAADGAGGVAEMIVMLLALLLQSMGLGKGLTANFKSQASPDSSPTTPQPLLDDDKPITRMVPPPLVPRPGF